MKELGINLYLEDYSSMNGVEEEMEDQILEEEKEDEEEEEYSNVDEAQYQDF
eukprot:CAMPEP_0202979190 /NCGR_PEP_ID=MMETSP1396-20130829/85414_1 /ASSEMBLY_ACC=CAM_ASM_000872 /TAXON_ID= /ORGANISM="Pseudokeronopsis sp., Strain Brazil" /LENGTH=51 /DNA_ID=CAMNT_0049718521 /DNA_START=1107 /DNA_END=1262 /DNA_ORIENTATION=-